MSKISLPKKCKLLLTFLTLNTIKKNMV